VHGAGVGDLQQAGALVGREIAVARERHPDQPPTFVRIESGFDLHTVERPALPARVHPQRDGGARTEAREEHLEGLGTDVAAPRAGGLVRAQGVAAGGDDCRKIVGAESEPDVRRHGRYCSSLVKTPG
jgi:hypothetical protein